MSDFPALTSSSRRPTAHRSNACRFLLLKTAVVLAWACTTQTNPSEAMRTRASNMRWRKSGPSTWAPRTPFWNATTAASRTFSKRSSKSKQLRISKRRMNEERMFEVLSQAYDFCVLSTPGITSRSLTRLVSGTSTASSTTWLHRRWSLREALSGLARTTTETCSPILWLRWVVVFVLSRVGCVLI